MSEANGEIPEIKSVGIIGAGQMGNGIAHVFAVAGYDVHLSDISDERLEQARESIGANLDRQIEHEKISSDDKAAALARITMGTGLELFGDCDLVIESVVENEEVKRGVLKQLCPLLKPEAIICSNTSSISITRLASVTDRPGRREPTKRSRSSLTATRLRCIGSTTASFGEIQPCKVRSFCASGSSRTAVCLSARWSPRT